MKSRISPLSIKQSATQAEVDKYIAQADQMRADYIAQSLKSGFAALRGLFWHKPLAAKIDIKFSAAHS